MSTTGRNEPCPCGSGKKYKTCCLRHDQDGASPNTAKDFGQDIGKLLAETEFTSLEEAQAQLDLLFAKKNAAPIEAFHTLSATQMHSFLYRPFDSPELVHFSTILNPEISAPAMKLFSLIVDAIGNEGLKPTAKGNLPQKFCREAARIYWADQDDIHRLRIDSVRSEDNFFDLHCIRLLAEMCGILRKFKGKFIIGTKYRKIVASQGPTALFPELLKKYLTEFNWAYGDGYEEIHIVQQSFLFSLYLLNKYGDIARPQEYYEDAFLAAFPDVLKELQDRPYLTAEQQLRRMYFLRTFYRGFRFFGLAELTPTPSENLYSHYDVKKTNLLDQVVSFSM
ncbi:YecA family protein [Desulforhopalus sp. IMCC35007]|uniref:YecA family protein n=1 Tax=Desulforhopalus sp. IMCC35007 TaxID=2569543 RepID=UPI0010AE09BF|nr:SEC-C domain-containing protein [Desulforhopalus sp. IMCC35007]TKB05636.1 SEC-C domain-containing protein [Desulforhopalus sp. IMCC35007]